jgi:hypothetical protein
MSEVCHEPWRSNFAVYDSGSWPRGVGHIGYPIAPQISRSCQVINNVSASREPK